MLNSQFKLPKNLLAGGQCLDREMFCLKRFDFTLYFIIPHTGSSTQLTEAMFTLYRIGFCSVSKVAPVQCEQELMFCCGAEIVPKRSQCERKPYPLCNLHRSLLI